MGKTEKLGFVGVVRVRRITGYTTGSVDRWNGAKRAELKDRVAHKGVSTVASLAG